VIEDLLFAREIKQMDLRGFTLIPDHSHLMFVPMGREDYSRVMGTFKRNVSRDINDLITGRSFVRNLSAGDDSGISAGDDSGISAGDDSGIPAGDDSNRRLRENFKQTQRKYLHLTFELYVEHFRNLEQIANKYRMKYPMKGPFIRFQWQKSFRDHIIRDDRDYYNHLDYIYNNAVKHGLVTNADDWPFMWKEGLKWPKRQ
jgi:REP element-mobilizing transposase RayT